jgi:hypothetical protein
MTSRSESWRLPGKPSKRRLLAASEWYWRGALSSNRLQNHHWLKTQIRTTTTAIPPNT